jgi:nucleotide-binding universal stress UspA family protein
MVDSARYVPDRGGVVVADALSNVVVVGVDGSADSSAALHWALSFAGEQGATVRLVHVWTTVPWYEELSGSGGDPFEDRRDRSAEDAAQRTARTLRELSTMPMNVEALLVTGSPGEVLVDSSRDARLLVVGASGRGGPAALRADRVGATARHVSRNAVCPVSVIGLGRAPISDRVLHSALRAAPDTDDFTLPRAAEWLAQPA